MQQYTIGCDIDNDYNDNDNDYNDNGNNNDYNDNDNVARQTQTTAHTNSSMCIVLVVPSFVSSY